MKINMKEMKRIVFALFCLFVCGGFGFAQFGKVSEPYEELSDSKPHDGAEIWNKQATTQLSWGSTDIRYAKLNVPDVRKTSHVRATAWRGERVNLQAVLWTTVDLSDVTAIPENLKCSASLIPAEAIKTHFVRYIMTDELNKDGAGACGERPDKTAWDSSLVADVLDITDKIAVKAHTTQAIWVNIWIPSDMQAGKYTGKLTVSGKNLSPMTLNVELDVLNRTLPLPGDWQFHLDLWQHPYAVARYYQVPLWSSEHFEAMRPIMKVLADAGQKVITATIMHKPWNGQTEDPFCSMVGKTKRIDGTWTYDYTVFDRWVEFMHSVGIDRQINCYTMIPWALHFDYIDQATNKVEYVDAIPGDTLYRQYWGSFLADFARHLKQKGWFDKTTIAMDERPLASMTEAIKLIRAVDADFKISLAGLYHPEIADELYDLCIAFGHQYPPEIKTAREKAGKISTVYTCCSEARPNTFTFSPPAEAAWIGWHVMAGNYDGYLRWSYNSWTIDPLRDSRFRTWAAGDCYLVYPGARSSIRMERLIEGIQDCEKCRILRAEFTQKGEKARLKRLNDLISSFTIDELTAQGAGRMVENARRVLNGF
jgi:hypothetical protein